MIPQPYRVPDIVKRIRIQIDKDYPDPREQAVEDRNPCPMMETAYSRRYHRGIQRTERAIILEKLVEESRERFIEQFLEAHEDDPELRYVLQGRAALVAAQVLWQAPFRREA